MKASEPNKRTEGRKQDRPTHHEHHPKAISRPNDKKRNASEVERIISIIQIPSLAHMTRSKTSHVHHPKATLRPSDKKWNASEV